MSLQSHGVGIEIKVLEMEWGTIWLNVRADLLYQFPVVTNYHKLGGNLFSHSLEARSPKSSVGRAMFFLKAPKENLFYAFLLAFGVASNP